MLWCSACSPAWSGAHEEFLAVEAALKRGDRVRFEQGLVVLQDHPLRPYLQFEDLRRRLAEAAEDEVESFLAAQAKTPLAARLRPAWLDRLARERRWAAYIRAYQPDASPERRCLFLQALIQTGRAEEAFGQVEPLWLTGQNRPAACDPVFAAWRVAGHLSLERLWQRIALAMARGQDALARHLGRLLPATEQPWLALWREMQAHPESLLEQPDLPTRHSQGGTILVQGVERLANPFPRTAAWIWDRARGQAAFSDALSERADAAIGYALVDENEPLGLDYLARIPARADNRAQQERRLRAGLRLAAWPRVAAWIAALPDDRHKSEHWLYWQARALEAQGQAAAAESLDRQAAQERSLWGFLAAERRGLPYRLDQTPVAVTEAQLADLLQRAAGKRLTALHDLDRTLEIRRELIFLLRTGQPPEQQAVAVLAGHWGLPDLAIAALARSDYWDDLERRFPLAHRDLIRVQAAAHGLDESWILAILRQESAFNPGAVSSAGALGLMQLLPATAGELAKRLGETIPNRWELLDPARNIRLGSAYLARLHRRFAGHPAVASAAYNAGPTRVSQWLPARPLRADLWMATLPFGETRAYVRRVLAYRLIYDHRLGRSPQPLSGNLGPVSAGLLDPDSGGSSAAR